MNIALFFITFFFMEFVAWFAHKYIMHGWMWSFHEDHHVPHGKETFIEKNDSFFIFFATPGITCIILDSFFNVPYCGAIGYGITAYGFCYFLVHDVFIHQRIKWLRDSNNFYMRAIRRAHKMHHKHITKEDGECFGMLLVPFKYFKDEKKKH